MRATIRVTVARKDDKLVEVHDLVLEASDVDERMELEMFKARATVHPLFSLPTDPGGAVVRLVRML